MKEIIARATNINVEDSAKRTPLYYASFIGESEAVQLLVESGADINATDENKITCLHLFANRGTEPETVQYLIEHGAYVDARDAYERTSMHLAAILGKLASLN